MYLRRLALLSAFLAPTSWGCSLTTSFEGLSNPPDEPRTTHIDFTERSGSSDGGRDDGASEPRPPSDPSTESLRVTELRFLYTETKELIWRFGAVSPEIAIGREELARITVEAVVSGKPGSVVFDVDGDAITKDNDLPFDATPASHPTFAPGNTTTTSSRHVLRATPYTEASGQGFAGVAASVTISIDAR